MSAKVKAFIGVVIGCLSSIGIYIYTNNIVTLYAMPAFALYGFGYAFSFDILKSWLAKAARASSDIAFMSLIFQIIAGRGLFLGLFICIMIFSCAIGLAYLPGIFIGLKALLSGSNDSVENNN